MSVPETQCRLHQINVLLGLKTTASSEIPKDLSRCKEGRSPKANPNSGLRLLSF